MSNADSTDGVRLPSPFKKIFLRQDSKMTPAFQTYLGKVEWGFDQVKLRSCSPGEGFRASSRLGADYYSVIDRSSSVMKAMGTKNEADRLRVKQKEKMIGSYTIIPKILKVGDVEIPAFLGANFSLSPSHRRRGLGKVILKQVRDLSLKQYPSGPRLDYAYVESSNLASYHSFLKSGYESLARMSILHFSRTFTKSDSRVSGLTRDDLDEMLALLESFYQGYVLTDIQNDLIPYFYSVIKDRKGTILAGAQATPNHWYIEQLTGLDGWLALHVMPWIPFLGRYVQRDMHSVGFRHLYVKKGYEHQLAVLMNHLLNRYQVYSGITAVDPRSELVSILRQNDLGPLNALAGEGQMEVMVHWDGIDPDIREKIRVGPIYP